MHKGCVVANACAVIVCTRIIEIVKYSASLCWQRGHSLGYSSLTMKDTGSSGFCFTVRLITSSIFLLSSAQ